MTRTARPTPETHEPESGTVRAAVPFRNATDVHRAAFEMPTAAPPPPVDRPTERPVLVDVATLDGASLRAPRLPVFDVGEGAPTAWSFAAEANRSAPTDRPATVRDDARSAAELGGPDAVPRTIVSGAALRELALDHREGFLLSRVDGVSTLDEILDVSGLGRSETLRLLAVLRDKGAIAFGTLERHRHVTRPSRRSR